MRRALTTVLAVALLLGLGALAVLALPNANTSLAAAPAVAGAAPEFNPDAPSAPAASNKFNNIALPLDSTAQLTYTADGLMAYLGPSVQQVLSWDAPTQGYLFRYSSGFGDNFSLTTGGSYWVELDPTAPSVASFVGNVPAQGAIKFNFVGAATACKWNQFSLPLDQGSITSASQLLTSIGANADQVLSWDATSQGFLFRYANGFGDDFPVKIGYPYSVCMYANQTWPQ